MPGTLLIAVSRAVWKVECGMGCPLPWGCRVPLQLRKNLRSGSANKRPMSCITMNIGTDSGAIPANESLNARAMVTEGLASEVDDVNQ